MKKALVLFLLALCWCSHARAQDFVQSYALVQAKPAGPGTGTSFANTGITSFAIFWTPATTVSSCSVQLDSSGDGINWGNGDLIPAQNCAVTGSVPAATLAAGAIYVRINVTVLTGNGGVNVTLKGWGGAGGVSGAVGPGTPLNVGCFVVPTNLQNCVDQITDTPGVGVNIPAPTTIGGGAGTASIAMPSGPTSGCQTPATGKNIICSDGTLNTMDLSLNGAPFTPICVNSTGCGGGGSSGSSQTFNVLTYGAVCDGYHIAADTAGIKAAITAAGLVQGMVYFPANTHCNFDTAAAAYIISNFSGTIAGEGWSSIITSNTDSFTMWDFRYPTNFTIRNLHFIETPSGFNTGAYPVGIDTGTNILISHNYTNDGDTAWRIGNSTHVRFEGNSCSNQHGNCVFGPNNVDFHSVNTSCFNNGDTCEEYSRWKAETSPICRNITSTGMTSFNDGTGFIVDSCTDVSLSNFTIYTPGGGTSGAIYIAQDQLTTNDHYPNRVQVSNGYVYGQGYSNGNINNSFSVPCINLKTVDNISEPYNVLLSNIHLEHCAGAGIFVNDPNFVVNLQADNIRIIDAGAGGTSAGDPENIGINFTGGKTLKMSNIYVENAYGSSFQAASGNSNTYIELNNFTSVNPNQRGTSSFINSIHNRNTSGTFLLNGAYIVDTWATANRSGVVSAATSGISSAMNVQFNCVVTCAVPNFSNTTATMFSVGGGQQALTTVALLPTAATANKGQWRIVSDSTAISAEGQTCVGSSSNTALAFSNGSVWKCF